MHWEVTPQHGDFRNEILTKKCPKTSGEAMIGSQFAQKHVQSAQSKVLFPGPKLTLSIGFLHGFETQLVKISKDMDLWRSWLLLKATMRSWSLIASMYLGYEDWRGWMVWTLNVENHVDAALLVWKWSIFNGSQKEWRQNGPLYIYIYIYSHKQFVSRWSFQTFFVFSLIWGNDPIWWAYFSNGLKLNHQLGIGLNLEVANIRIISASSPRDGPWRYSGVVVLVGLLWGKANAKKV